MGQALGAIDASEFRQEWDVWDLQYRHASIEVKTSGLNQYWSPLRRSQPSFGITLPKQTWCEQTKERQAKRSGNVIGGRVRVLSAHIAAGDQRQRRMPLHLGILREGAIRDGAEAGSDWALSGG